jgi:hypothetical protein
MYKTMHTINIDTKEHIPEEPIRDYPNCPLWFSPMWRKGGLAQGALKTSDMHKELHFEFSAEAFFNRKIAKPILLGEE